MRIIYLMILNDISPDIFKEMIKENDLSKDESIFIKFDEKPSFIECMEIDFMMNEIPNKKWKHVLKIKDYIRSFEVIEYISSFSKTMSNI